MTASGPCLGGAGRHLRARGAAAGFGADARFPYHPGRSVPGRVLMKRKSVWLVSAALVAFVLSACNTVAGVGKDVEKAGEKIHDAARR